MKISLVTTCWNEFSNIDIWFSDLLNQKTKPDEIIIVDNFSTDGTYEFLINKKKEINLHIYQKKCSVAQGRNYAIKKASGNIIVSTDLGVRLDSKWFSNIIKPFKENLDIDVVAGNYKYIYPSSKVFCRAEKYIKNNGKVYLKEKFLPSNRNIAFNKYVWQKIGGYREELSNATGDTIFGLEIYYHHFNVYFEKDSIVFWYRHSNLNGYLKESFRYGMGNGEANIYKPFITKYINSNYIPLFRLLFILYRLKHSMKGLWRAFIHFDLIMFFIIPYFSIMNSVSYYQGYKKGYLNSGVDLNKLRKRIDEILR